MGDMLKSSREDNQIEECDSNPCVFFFKFYSHMVLIVNGINTVFFNKGQIR